MLLTGVASFTDAWIETLPAHRSCKSHPVASFTDAWIETPEHRFKVVSDKSHLLQMRGLKQYVSNIIATTKRSHLLQMRGLKHV